MWSTPKRRGKTLRGTGLILGLVYERVGSVMSADGYACTTVAGAGGWVAMGKILAVVDLILDQLMVVERVSIAKAVELAVLQGRLGRTEAAVLTPCCPVAVPPLIFPCRLFLSPLD